MSAPAYIQVILPLRLEWEPCYRVPEGTAVRVGDRVRVLFARKEYVGAVSAVGVQPQTDEKRILPILASEEGLPKVLPDEIKFWRAVSDYYLCSIGEVYKAAYPALKIDQEEVEARMKERLEARLMRLKDKAEKARREDTRERYNAEIEAVEALLRGEKPTVSPTPVTLSPAQETAAGSARKAFADGKTVLLHGVTGSGKTEIYLKLAQETLEKGRNVLILVPEIALSRQLEDRIAAVFPDVQVFHSGVSAARRTQVASRIRKPGPYLVLGTRSALFLPHHNLGLIVVDEEHDTSYKQDAPAPRYNARESAIMLGVIQKAQVVLGSATPSLESLYNAETGRFVKVDLKERFHAGDEAEIRLIDTVAERRKRGMTGSFSRKLIREITDTLDAGEQVLVLRARRSYAPSVQCTECGKIPKCPHCHVPMSLHRGPDRLVCHYCGHTEPYTGICPICHGELQPLGAGTQKVEEELSALFPGRHIARLDGDTPDTEEAVSPTGTSTSSWAPRSSRRASISTVSALWPSSRPTASSASRISARTSAPSSCWNSSAAGADAGAGPDGSSSRPGSRSILSMPGCRAAMTRTSWPKGDSSAILRTPALSTLLCGTATKSGWNTCPRNSGTPFLRLSQRRIRRLRSSVLMLPQWTVSPEKPSASSVSCSPATRPSRP